jgi:hypothetical protein
VQRLRAVVPDANRDSPVIQELADVVRVNTGNVETREANARQARCRAEQGYAAS